MWEAEKRLEILYAFSDKKISVMYLQADIEAEALQIRKLLELIAFSSLVAHKPAYESVRETFAKDWHAKRILNKIEKLNPNFYPIPFSTDRNMHRSNLRGGYLTRHQFEKLYDCCGGLLHSKNPFSRVAKSSLSFHAKVPEYTERIELLLKEHSVVLIGGKETINVSVPFFTGEPFELTYHKGID